MRKSPPPGPSFSAWLLAQQDARGELQQLALEWSVLRRVDILSLWPTPRANKLRSYEPIRVHMQAAGASQGTLKALDAAYWEWRARQDTHATTGLLQARKARRAT
jgi:hypothetical protein